MSTLSLSPRQIDLFLATIKSCSYILIWSWIIGGFLVTGLSIVQLIKLIDTKQHIEFCDGLTAATIMLSIFSTMFIFSAVFFEIIVLIFCLKLRKTYPEIKLFYLLILIVSPLIGGLLIYLLIKKIIRKRLATGQASDQNPKELEQT